MSEDFFVVITLPVHFSSFPPFTLTNFWTYLSNLLINVFSKMQDVSVKIVNWSYLNFKSKYITCTVYAVRPTLTLDWILLASFHTTGFHSICWTGAFGFYWITPAQSYSISTTWDSFQFAFFMHHLFWNEMPMLTNKLNMSKIWYLCIYVACWWNFHGKIWFQCGKWEYL